MVYIPSGYDGKQQNNCDETTYLGSNGRHTPSYDSPRSVDKTQLYRAPVRVPHSRARTLGAMLHRTSRPSPNMYKQPQPTYHAQYQQAPDYDTYPVDAHDRFQMGEGASYILAHVLRLIAGLLRIYAWLLAGVCLVSTFGFSIGRAFILDIILITQAPIPRVLLGYMVVPSIFGGVVRGDLIVLACISACLDYFCMKWAWRLLK